MIIIVYDNGIITNILSCQKEDDIKGMGLENYNIYNETNGYVGLDINFLNDKGTLKSDKTLLEEGLITLKEDEILEGNTIRKLSIKEQIDMGIIKLEEDEILEGNTIRKLTYEELKDKFPDRYPTDNNNHPSELETLDMEIKNMEYEAGMEVVREMGRKRLLGEDNV